MVDSPSMKRVELANPIIIIHAVGGLSKQNKVAIGTTVTYRPIFIDFRESIMKTRSYCDNTHTDTNERYCFCSVPIFMLESFPSTRDFETFYMLRR
jgi:hypothetical protein